MNKNIIYIKGDYEKGFTKECLEDTAGGIHALAGYLFQELDQWNDQFEGDTDLIAKAWDVLHDLWDADIVPVLLNPELE